MNDTAVDTNVPRAPQNGPRVTPQDVENSIREEYYFTAEQGMAGVMGSSYKPNPNLRLMTFCVLVLQNGFKVTGESACVSPENFDPQYGQYLAKQHAMSKIWHLLGYALAEDVYQGRLTSNE